MANAGAEISDLEARLRHRERWVFVRTALFSALPIVAALIFLSWTYEEISRSEQRLSALQDELETTQRNLEVKQSELEATRRELSEALRKSATYQENLYDLNWDNLKQIASSYETSEILVMIDQMRRRDVGWALTGSTPRQGFNSPSFAAFILSETPQHRRSPLSPRDLLQSLERSPFGTQQPGDIVVYEAGYHMFYFRDHDGTEFVIGMTPEGLAALQLHFGPEIKYVLKAFP